ncbi:hypothetical protein [Halomonas organivorans]|uniref:Uncharacterized protein n=1 Tax=Halomonas organivorans TaxID=257772 RepID=A0A7W5BV62_9GAMM|nr:hypothetical protein [Halomonas organivorans]MBB3139404.1 hypothetical protein [Halomonas organivorans]
MTDPLADELARRVRRQLEMAPEAVLPMTYQQLAEALELTPPRTIRRVALALEALMREDAREGRPFLAALVVSRQGEGLPRAGFFELAVELGRFPDDPDAQATAWREEFRLALSARLTGR